MAVSSSRSATFNSAMTFGLPFMCLLRRVPLAAGRAQYLANRPTPVRDQRGAAAP